MSGIESDQIESKRIEGSDIFSCVVETEKKSSNPHQHVFLASTFILTEKNGEFERFDFTKNYASEKNLHIRQFDEKYDTQCVKTNL